MPEVEDNDDREDNPFPIEHDAQDKNEFDGRVEVDHKLSHQKFLVVLSLHFSTNHYCSIVE